MPIFSLLIIITAVEQEIWHFIDVYISMYISEQAV